MKRVRLLILTGLIFVALVAAVIPALADDDSIEILNESFEGDKNGDNIPDKWNVKGDVYRLCNHKYTSLDNCMMVFPPSNSGAALWQILDVDAATWVVVTEAETCYIGDGGLGALNFDWGRAYYGQQFTTFGGDKYVVYDEINGGTYPIDYTQFYVTVPDCDAPLGLTVDDIAVVKYGVVALPGDGYLGVDWLYFSIYY